MALKALSAAAAEEEDEATLFAGAADDEDEALVPGTAAADLAELVWKETCSSAERKDGCGSEEEDGPEEY